MFTDLFNINGGDYFGSMEEHFEGGDYSRGTREDFGYDPNYYHSWFDIRKVLNRTDKAVQVEALIGLAFWVPKKLIRGEKPGKILVHQQTYTRLMRAAAEEARNCLDALPNLDTGEEPAALTQKVTVRPIKREYSSRPEPFSKPKRAEVRATENPNRGRCPYCGTEYGMAWGTGDCGCEPDYD